MQSRYEIQSGAAGWEDAEKQIQRAVQAKGAKDGVTVSVRSVKGKRKGGETAEEVYREEIGDREAKRLRKGMSKNKTGRG